MHRIRETVSDNGAILFEGTVEVDETYIREKESNKHSKDRLRAGRGTTGKISIAGIKDQKTKEVRAKAIEETDEDTLTEFIHCLVKEEVTISTDSSLVYKDLHKEGFFHESVIHSWGNMSEGA